MTEVHGGVVAKVNIAMSLMVDYSCIVGLSSRARYIEHGSVDRARLMLEVGVAARLAALMENMAISTRRGCWAGVAAERFPDASGALCVW